jgi:pantoate--beta-alanine ligase
MSMQVVSDPLETQSIVSSMRMNGWIIGCVPTMGALHAGHASLIEQARQECNFVVTTIFVNPTQFGPNEDFTKYPRTLDADLEVCRQSGADLIFTPSADVMYPPSSQTVIRVNQLSAVLEGAHRPGHFDGVTTVVAKLLNITQPHNAYFGQKDFQQQLVIRRMVSDLNMPVQVITCPIVREADGLAMSSRNRYLSAADRRTAAEISAALRLAESLARDTSMTPPEIAAQMAAHLTRQPGIELQYAVVCNADTLEPLQNRGSEAVALIAVRIGTTRLIDNCRLSLC